MRRYVVASALLALLGAIVYALLPIRVLALELGSIEQAAAGYRSPNSHLQEMFRAALLDTSRLAQYAPDGTAYIMTGDIPAEWLRDASAQARPYLFFAKDDPDVRALLRGIVARMVKYLQIDPYANAYTLDYRVWEQKFELDSLAYPTALAWSYRAISRCRKLRHVRTHMESFREPTGTAPKARLWRRKSSRRSEIWGRGNLFVVDHQLMAEPICGRGLRRLGISDHGLVPSGANDSKSRARRLNVS